jgi:hypothetical protein
MMHRRHLLGLFDQKYPPPIATIWVDIHQPICLTKPNLELVNQNYN